MKTEYTRVGDAGVAYRVLGDGPLDLLYFMGEYMPVDALEEDPRYARCLRRLSSLGRLIMFNRRGVGLSDAPDGPLTMEQPIEDALAVLDAVDSSRAVAVGFNVGSPFAIKLTAEHPERVSALVLGMASARLIEAPDYPIGIPEELMITTSEQTTSLEPNEFDFLSVFAPTVAGDDRFRTWWDSVGHRGASPARSRELWKLILAADVRDLLPAISVPTLVVNRMELGNVELGRYVAAHIPGARLVEVHGHDLMWWIGDSEPILAAIESFVGEAGAPARTQRRLATVLFADVVGSTERAVALGDRHWRDLLNTYHDVARRSIERAGGNEVSTSGDGILATFDMPADAVRCAQRIAQDVRTIGIDIRAGVHTGEIEIVGDDVAGIGVHIAARVMSAAAPGEVLVSRTVADLVTGSGLSFDERGEHELKGVPGRWALYAVADSR